MKVEDELKALILERFKSVRAFSIAIDTPYSTINNIFTRGVSGAGLSTIIPLCRALNLDIDALADEKIKYKANLSDVLSSDEQKLLSAYRNFNNDGKNELLRYADYLSTKNEYKKCPSAEQDVG